MEKIPQAHQRDSKFETDKLFKRSRFLHIFLLESDVVCLFHSLKIQEVYGGKLLIDLYNMFSQPISIEEAISSLILKYPKEDISGVIKDFIKKKKLISDNKEDIELYTNLFYQGLNLSQIQHMYFIPTTACNFRCKYCFVEDDGKDLAPSFMTKDIAKKGLELFAKLSEGASHEISITFYGGEPLLNPEVVCYSLRYVRELEKQNYFKRPVTLSILTNGSLVNEEVIEVLKKTNTRVSVSIDGPEHIHNASRIYTNGSGTFKEAMNGYHLFQEAGLNPGISCTLSVHNLRQIEEVTNFIVSLKPNGVGFNILLPKMNRENPNEEYYDFATIQLIKAFKILRKHGIYEDRMMRRVRPFVEQSVHFKDCMGVGGQIVITPEGKIGPCQAFLGLDQYFPLKVEELCKDLDNISSTKLYEEPLFNEWCHRFPMNMKDCLDCPAIGICGGGCPYASFVKFGSIWEIDDRICYQCKPILEWMIWDTYKNLKKNG